MKIKSGFVARNVGGNRIVLATGERSKRFGGMIRLNESAGFLWDRLMAESDRIGLISSLLAEYDVDEETAAADVDAFLNTLREAGVLDE